MTDLNGFDNEYAFVTAFNGKKINELNPLLKDVINDLYPNEDENSTIKCWRNHYKQKTDIFLKINNKMKGISIKQGMKNSVHMEDVACFIEFLKNIGISQETINEYLKYHYADGTINGNGIIRISAEEYKLQNQDQIDQINKSLNNKKVISAAIERFVIKGNNSEFYIDGMIYGNPSDFLWLNKNAITEIILTYDRLSTAVHFGPLIVQPKTRCLNYNSKFEKDRYYVQIKWYSLFDDIIAYLNKKSIQKNYKE